VSVTTGREQILFPAHHLGRVKPRNVMKKMGSFFIIFTRTVLIR